jgi:two-component system cell cycle response regulator
MDKNLKILVVDGSRVARKLISRALGSEIDASTMEIAAVSSAGEAIQLLAAHRFDLITSALLLSDMYGIELCRKVRSSQAHRFTPFVLVTGEPHERLMKEGFGAGVTDYYDKTRGFKDFLAFVRSLAARYSRLYGKVLYLEDNDAEARATIAIMEHHGLDVVRVKSAEQALDVIDKSFDLVVSDFFLSESMSGGDFLHNLRCGHYFTREELPVLIITGGDRPNLQAEIFHAGGNEYVNKPIVEEIFVSRIRSLLLIKQQFRMLKKQSEEMQRMASVDSLTGVFNKRYLVDNIDAILEDTKSHPAWLAMIDLDHFKSINDHYGHMAGDHVLRGVGRLMKGFFRDTDIVARVGGEEFVVVMTRRTPRDCLAEIESLRRAIEALQPGGFGVTASIGLANNIHQPRLSLDELLFAADTAMYRAKQIGRNRVCQAGGTSADANRL